MTIKTQGGKVVTKDGKVSCECCGECCLYSAEALTEGLYTIDDLPDEIIIAYRQDLPPLVKGAYTGAGTPVPANYAPAGWPGEDDEYIEDVIFLQDSLWASGQGVGRVPLCLIDGINWEDLFADTYTVSGPISGTVTRESVCVWRGSNLRLTNFGFQWKVNGNNKSGFQNTPVGSYAGGYSVS